MKGYLTKQQLEDVLLESWLKADVKHELKKHNLLFLSFSLQLAVEWQGNPAVVSHQHYYPQLS